jgi:hypothetical protein
MVGIFGSDLIEHNHLMGDILLDMNKNTKSLKFGKWFIIIIAVIFSFYVGIEYEQSLSKSLDLSSNASTDTLISPESYNSLKQRFLKLKVDNQLLVMWGIIQGTFVNNLFPNRYYYSQSFSSDSIRIGYYDITNDLKSIFENENSINIAEQSTWVYERNIPIKDQGNVFRIVGFDNNKLVFYEINSDDTPGPCSNPWIRTGSIKYEYLDITDNSSIPKPYKLSSIRREKYQKEEGQCIKDNS